MTYCQKKVPHFVAHLVTTSPFYTQNTDCLLSDWATISRPSPRTTPKREKGRQKRRKWTWQPHPIFTHSIQPPKMERKNQCTLTSLVSLSVRVNFCPSIPTARKIEVFEVKIYNKKNQLCKEKQWSRIWRSPVVPILLRAEYRRGDCEGFEGGLWDQSLVLPRSQHGGYGRWFLQ